MIKEMAQDFSRSSLLEIAAAAEERSSLLRRGATVGSAEWNAADDFRQLAAYCRRVVELGES